MTTIRIKTLWNGCAWVADHVLRKVQKSGKGIVIKYLATGEKMTVPPDKVDARYWIKGSEVYRDKFRRDNYFLFGMKFVPDEEPSDPQVSLF